jgi:predicted Zn-dependent protease
MSYYYGNRGGGGGFGIPLQWIIGGIIAIIGFFLYFTHISVNPTTGEKQHVDLTPNQEIALGIQSAPQMAAEMGGEVPPNDPQSQEVQYIGNRIWRRSQANDSPYPFHYHLLADRQTINAFALSGGEVFITKGLLDRLTTEGELAGVLGHESGHVVERHVAQQMAQGQLGKFLVVAMGVAASNNRHPYAETAVAALLNHMTQLHFSREDESQADQKGLEFMTEAGYDPRSMLHVMEVLQQVTNEQGGREPQILVTHPYPEQRMQDINAWIKQHYPNGVPSGLADPPLPWIR